MLPIFFRISLFLKVLKAMKRNFIIFAWNIKILRKRQIGIAVEANGNRKQMKFL